MVPFARRRFVLSKLRNHSRVQSLVALTPLLSVLLAVVGLVLTSTLQAYDHYVDTRLKVNSDWRTALEHLRVDEDSAHIGVFEMETFLKDKEHQALARNLAAATLPQVGNEYQFDPAFIELLNDTDEQTQGEILGIDRSLVLQLSAIYEKSKRNAVKPRPAEDTLAHFIIDPESFLDEETQSDQIKRALTKAWELETVSSGLSDLWTGRSKHPRLRPDRDLVGIVLKDNDFRGVDFSGVDLSELTFVGHCMVDQKKLRSAVVLCS